MTRRRHSLLREFVGPAVLLLATLGFFWRILFAPDAWKPAGGGDLVSFLYPIYRFAAAKLGDGELPLWQPHLYSGAPFLADMQTGMFYLPNLLLFLLAPTFAYKAMVWMVVLHVFLAGLLMYVCLRYLEPGLPLRIPAALTGAIAYMFSDLFTVHFGNLNLVAVAAWLPLIFLLFWWALRRRSLGWAVVTGVVLGISTLVGHLQITLYVGLVLAVLTLVDIAATRRQRSTEWRSQRRDWAWGLLALLVTAVVAVGLTALVLLPAFEYAHLSPRAQLPYKQAARYSLVPGLLGEMVVPALFNTREPAVYWGVWDRVAVGYLGIFPLILAGLAIVLWRGRRIAFFSILVVVGLLLALGGESVIHGWAYWLLPGFDQLRAPGRAVLLVDFGLAALAAIGLNGLLQPLDPRRRRTYQRAWQSLLWIGALAALVGAAWAYLVIYLAQDRDPTVFWRVSAAGSGMMFAVLMLGASLAWLSGRRAGHPRRSILAWLAVGIVFVDLASVGAYTDLGEEAPTAGYDHPRIVEYLQSDPGFFRIDSRTDVWDLWQPNLALVAGLYDIGGVDNPLVVADVARYWEGTGGRSTRLYDLLGVHYVLGSKEVVLDWDKFGLAFEGDPTVNVYRNETALPRAFVVHQSVVAADHEDAWDLIHQPGFDPETTVVLEGGQQLDVRNAEQARVEMVSYDLNSLEIAVESAEDGYLFLSDPYYPGWQAELDGEVVPILRANYAFRAVAIPTGVHRVRMNFQPITWYAGLATSAATVLILVLLTGAVLLRRGWSNSLGRRRPPGS